MNRPRCIVWSITPAEGGGFEPPVREPVRQFSKLLVSATHPSFQKDLRVRNLGVISSNAGAKVQPFFQSCKYFANFFQKKLFKGYHLRQLGIEVERVLQGVALMYVAHSQIVKLSVGYVGVGNALFEEWSAAMAHQLD